MLRAGPLSDERIVRLVNRRFVPFFFDLSPFGAAGDAEARKFVVAARKDLGGGAVSPPPVLLMKADGEVVAEIDNFASAAEFLKSIQQVLKDHPAFAAEDDKERKATGVDRAEVLFDLQDWDGARALLAKETGARAAYLSGRIARLRGDWESMDKSFGLVDDPALADDVRMERAWRLWKERSFAKLAEALGDFPKDSNRFTEARYVLGLAEFHGGDKEKALDIWKRSVAECAQDPWTYRADWAWFGVKFPNRTSFSAAQKGTTPMGRIGYAFNRNPDLEGP